MKRWKCDITISADTMESDERNTDKIGVKVNTGLGIHKRIIVFVFTMVISISMLYTPVFAEDSSDANTQNNAGSTEGTSETYSLQSPTVQVESKTATGVTISWDAVEGASDYEILRSASEDGGFTKIAETQDLTYTDSGLISNSTYYYCVKATNGELVSDLSETVTATTEYLTTKVSGVALTQNAKARYKHYDTVMVTYPYGRTIRLQLYTGGKWVTKKSYKLNSGATSQKIKLYFPSAFWNLEKSKWRYVISKGDRAAAYTSSTVTLKTKRYYQNPSSMYQISNKCYRHGTASYNLKIGCMGLKTKWVNNFFGIGSKHWPRYTKTTAAKVKKWQKKHGLKATGVVDKKTWLKMGGTEYAWNYKGWYISPCLVNNSSTRKQCVEAMIKTAYKYKGSSYVVGASGSPKQGTDCSGLVMQACYGAGVDLYPITPCSHSKPGHEYESKALYKSKKLKKVSWKKRKRGDLIFYSNSSGTIIHVAIYLGKNKIIHAWPNKVRVSSVYGWGNIAGVRRVFN